MQLCRYMFAKCQSHFILSKHEEYFLSKLSAQSPEGQLKGGCKS